MRSAETLMRLAGALLATVTGAGAVVTDNGFQIPENLFRGTRSFGCPSPCSVAGPSSSNWTQLHRISDFSRCNGTFLFDMNVQSDPYAVGQMRVCSMEGADASGTDAVPQNVTIGSRSPKVSSGCGAKVVASKTEIMTARQSGTDGHRASPSAASSAALLLASYLEDSASCGSTILFANVEDVVVGIYAGSEVAKSSAAGLARMFSDQASDSAVTLQVCAGTNSSQGPSKSFGIFATTLKNMPQVQLAVRSWANTGCLDTAGASTAATMDIGYLVAAVDSPSNSTMNSNRTMGYKRNAKSARVATGRRSALPTLHSRGDCTTVKVVSGDTCASLATECGISGNDFEDYNSGTPNLCSTLAVGQFVCCSEGTLPDPSPQTNPDGSCYTYTFQSGDSCSAVAQSYYITVSDINDFNKNTWAWAGCSFIEAGQVICLSKGTAPFPAAVEGVECGPTVPGTVAPTDGTNISTMNPCPLNACCDAWGFCGVTEDYCTISLADTGAPGTHKNGTNGCISNCGTDIISESSQVTSPILVGYFEGYNYNRSCLYMDVSQIPSDKSYTHIHFGFGTIASNFDISMDDVDEDQWSEFSGNSEFPYNRILSFGGWAFSTDPSTYDIFRTGVQEANRDTFALNVADFVASNWMDGVDFDWEYPGEPDIPGIPAGSKDDGQNYLEFLKRVRYYLGDERTISISLPASFWYLKAFPVKDLADVVDYFVFMTYDLHGQWDYGNSNVDPGCPGGNCLRSHVNKTETATALSMITKAGVSSHKIVMGVSMYGRSFRMTDSSCTGPMCTYGGGYDASTATPGICTDTAGYLADAEIQDIIDDTWNILETYYDADSASNILVYGDSKDAVDWVAYENSTTRDRRLDWALLELNMAGTVAWAIDLENELDYVAPDGDNSTDYVVADIDLSCDPALNPGDMSSLEDQVDSIEPSCWNRYALDILSNTLDEVMDNYTQASDGYDSVYSYYVKWVKEMIGPSLYSYMNFDTGKGNQYFTCSWKMGQTKGESKCPPSAHIWQGEDTSWTVTYTLDDADGFYAAVESDLGISKDWIKFGEYLEPLTCAETDNDRPGGGVQPCRKILNKREGFPLKADDITVTNPKQVIGAASDNITDLQTTLMMGTFNANLALFGSNDTSGDAVVASSMPVFMLQQAVNSMFTIKSIGEKAKEEAKKNLILEILGIVLLFIPFVGEGIGAAFDGVAGITRIATLIGEVGNDALAIQQIVDDPTSAPVVIMGLLIGVAGAGKSDREVFEDAAAARMAMTEVELKSFSSEFREKDDIVQTIVKQCVMRDDSDFS